MSTDTLLVGIALISLGCLMVGAFDGPPTIRDFDVVRIMAASRLTALAQTSVTDLSGA